MLLKYLKEYLRTAGMPLITCEVSLIVTTRDAVLAQGGNPAVPSVNNPANTTFNITDTKLYVPVTLSTEDDNNLLQLLKTALKRKTKWNKYRSEVSNQNQNNNLDYLLGPTFTKVNRLFVL